MSRAEDLHSPKEREFDFQWKIANLGMFGGIQENILASPKFIVPFLDNSEWYLKLVLNEDDDKKTAMCFLHRMDTGPETIKIFYSLSVGSFYNGEHESFGKNTSSTKSANINIYEMAEKLDQFLFKDVLIECHLHANEFMATRETPKSPYPVFCSTRTVIPCEQRNFYFPVRDFNGLSIENIRVHSGDLNSGSLNFSCELSKVSYTTLGMTFKLKFFKSDMQDLKPFVLRYRIQLVDALKSHHILLSGRLIQNSVSNGVTFVIPTSMLENKNLFIPGNMMLLFCEFAVSANEFHSFVESTRYDCSGIQSMNLACGWGVYLDHKYNENRFLFRILAVLVFIVSLIIPHLFTGSSL